MLQVTYVCDTHGVVSSIAVALKDANLNIKSSETLPVCFHFDGLEVPVVGLEVLIGEELVVPPVPLVDPLLVSGLGVEAAAAFGGGGDLCFAADPFLNKIHLFY